jgi:hypothetical protein
MPFTTKGIKMTRLEFAELVKNMGGYAGVCSRAIGCGKSTVGYMVSNGYISNQNGVRGDAAAHKDGYKVKITDINRVMT